MTDKSVWMPASSLLLLLLLLPSMSAHADAVGTAYLINFGADAERAKGDDDFTEVIYIRVPQSFSQQLYLRVFDPDVGGSEDEPTGPWNTRTRFSLFGGKGADSSTGPAAGTPAATLKPRGTVLAQAIFGEDPLTDGKWHTLGSFSPGQGEAVAGYTVFALVVEGLEGNDGNLFDVAVSTDSSTNHRPLGVSLENDRPTFTVPPGSDRIAEARFLVPPGISRLQIRNFDLDRADIRFQLPFVPAIPLRASVDGRWLEDRVPVEPDGQLRPGAVIVRGGHTLRNNVVLQVSDQSGTPLAFQLPIRLFRHGSPPRPAVEIETLADCDTVMLDAGGSDDKANRRFDYRWDFGDGQQGNGRRSSHRYAKPGTYRVVLTMIDESGRIADRARREYSVKVNQPPEAVPGPQQIAAPGEQLHFDAGASRDADGGITGFHWAFGDGHQGDGAHTSHAYAKPGVYPVTLRVEDDGPGPCGTATAATEVWINAPPAADAGDDLTAAVGETLTLNKGLSRDKDGVLQVFHWDLGDGRQVLGPSVQHAYAAPGRYTVTLTVEDDAGASNSQAVDRITVTINDPPLAVADGARRGAVGERLTFNASASRDTDGRLIEYAWDFGDGYQATGVDVSHSYAAPGGYLVTLTVRDDSETGSDTGSAQWPVIINRPPLADAGSDQLLTASEVRFDASRSHDPDGSIVDWRWDFGDGASGQGPRPVHVYAAPGRYAVVLTVTDDSGTTSASARNTITVVINTKPVADAGADRMTAPEQPVTFDGSGSFDPDGVVVAYHWELGDGEVETGATFSHSYSKPGAYSVRLQVRDNSGHPQASGVADALITVNARPTAIAGQDLAVAPGQVVELDAGASHDPDGEIVSYRWTFSDGQAAMDGRRVRRSFSEPGRFTATLDVADNSGAANSRHQDRLAIRVNHPPTAIVGEPIHRCSQQVELDGSASRDADGDRLHYTWVFGDGSPPRHGPRVVHRYPEGGRYPVMLTVDDGTGLSNATHSAATMVALHRPPVAVAEAEELACAADVILFNGTRSQDTDGGRLLFSWDFGDGTTAQGPNPAKSYGHAGVYAVRLRVEDDSGLDCNTGHDRIVVTVADAPVADAGQDRTLCANTPVAFDGSASRDSDGVVNSYSWDFGDGAKGGGVNPTHVFNSAGEYPVTLTVTGDRVGNCGNRSSDEVLITALAAPRVAVEAPAEAPLGDTITFDAAHLSAAPGAAAATLVYHWEFGDGDRAEGQRVQHGYRQAGQYLVAVTANDPSGGECGQVRIEHPLRINAPPLAVAGDDRETAPNETVVFDGSASSDPDGAITRYQWDFGDGSQGRGVQVLHHYEQPGTYLAQLVVTDNTRLDNNQHSDRVTITVNAPPQPRFTFVPQPLCVGQDGAFDSSRSQDPDGALQSWDWDFGDGAVDKGAQVLHRYREPGRYTAAVTVTDTSIASNSSATLAREITVSRPPTAGFDAPRRGCPGETMSFDAARSLNPNGGILTYHWSFGDGSSAHGQRVSHTYSEPGPYPVTLTVADGSGSVCSSEQTTAVILINSAPEAKITLPATALFSGGAHDDVIFDATGSIDPDGDPVTYHWDFGDNNNGRGSKAAHVFDQPGRYTVTVEVRDSSGTGCASGTDQAQVQVTKRKARH